MDTYWLKLEGGHTRFIGRLSQGMPEASGSTTFHLLDSLTIVQTVIHTPPPLSASLSDHTFPLYTLVAIAILILDPGLHRLESAGGGGSGVFKTTSGSSGHFTGGPGGRGWPLGP